MLVLCSDKKLILNMKFRFLSALVAFFTLTFINAQEISDTSFGKGLINFTAKDSSFSVKFAPRFQVRSMSSWDYDGDQYGSPDHNFIVRRARLKFDGFAYSSSSAYVLSRAASLSPASFYVAGSRVLVCMFFRGVIFEVLGRVFILLFY